MPWDRAPRLHSKALEKAGCVANRPIQALERVGCVANRPNQAWHTVRAWTLTRGPSGARCEPRSPTVPVVAKLADCPKATLRPALFVVPTDAPGLEAQPIPIEIISPERQFSVFLDDVAPR